MTRDEMVSELFKLGFKVQFTASMKWKNAFFFRNGDKTFLVLVRSRGVDLFETSQTREGMTNKDGKLSVRVSDEGNRFGECNYTHNELNINNTVVGAATRFVEGVALSPELFQKTGMGRTEWAHKFGDLSKKQERAESSDNSLSDIYYAASSGDGSPAYLSDGLWIDSDQTFDDLGTTDTIIEAIRAGTIHTGNISFDQLRDVGARDHDCWPELGRGRNILISQEQLDQYLHSYGPMTKSQWGQFLRGVRLPAGRLRIVDYGCGQGLACALLFDHFGPGVIERVGETVLIEPSAIALARAKSVLTCYCENAPVFDLNQRLDELAPEYLKPSSNLSTIHLFSNVLDIDDFDYVSLFTKMLRTKGHHSVLAVSHDRDFDGGSARFHDINRKISDLGAREYFSVSTSEISQFSCSKGQPAISWQLHLEVLDGPV